MHFHLGVPRIDAGSHEESIDRVLEVMTSA